MRILYLESPAFALQDMIDAFRSLGIQCDPFFHPSYQERSDPDFDSSFDILISKQHYDFVFSFNYFAIISNCCLRHNVDYISYVYDCPLLSLYSCSVLNKCNHIFLFDKASYLKFHNEGINTMHYLPLAANVQRLSKLKCPSAWKKKMECETSFVGSLYNEDHNLFERLTSISDYTRGYLESIMNAQQKVYGQYFLEDVLSDDILRDLQQSVPYSPLPDGAETDSYVYANYFLARKITSEERLSLLGMVSEQFTLKLYTNYPSPFLPRAIFMGTVDPYNVAPIVYKNSTINLNISLKSIQSGIPLRCMEILGSGGFLLTNFQADFLDYFVPNEDFVFYEDPDDLLNKIRYYLGHNSEIDQIKNNALQKVSESHTFVHRAKEMISYL